ncbi:MAG: PQQ-binding-like beta-propeller repeat protein, partial [Verrucomicrobia subdivision 3 bacterium]|nr:PQQ-binding-like beta-propeller repeat protein [Limisphaerales bacterium]
MKQILLMIGMVALVGCGKKGAAPKPQEHSKAPPKPVTVLWEFETRGHVHSSPAIGPDGTVYVGSRDNKLYAIKT